MQFHDAEGRPLSRVEFRYDEAGNLVEEAQTRSEEALPPELLASLNEAQLQAFPSLFGAAGEPVRRLHQYDEHGRRIETRSQIGPLGWDCKAVVYNDQGDEIAEFSVDEERDYSIDDSGRLSDVPTKERVSRSEVRFRYDYDPRGNWVMKTVESRGVADQDFTLSSVERRTIEYFE